MLTVSNAAWIVATGLGLAYVVDGRLKQLMAALGKKEVLVTRPE